MNLEQQQEFMVLIEDILENETFLQLDSYYHHNSSILEHSIAVSYWSYRVCKTLRLDYASGARGALLHDFFLYDWRSYKKDPRNKNHGLEHPKTALANSHSHFVINRVEQDIILKHMWPKVIGVPRYWESVVVAMTDKVCACGEFISKARHWAIPLPARQTAENTQSAA